MSKYKSLLVPATALVGLFYFWMFEFKTYSFLNLYIPLISIVAALCLIELLKRFITNKNVFDVIIYTRLVIVSGFLVMLSLGFYYYGSRLGYSMQVIIDLISLIIIILAFFSAQAYSDVIEEGTGFDKDRFFSRFKFLFKVYITLLGVTTICVYLQLWSYFFYLFEDGGV